MLTAIGSEFIVNTVTANDQDNPAIAKLDGKFVAVWQSEDPYLTKEIRGQLFDSMGNKLGNEFVANTYTDSYQENPIILALSDNKFVVVWQSYLQDGSEYGIYGQLFDSAANKIGSEFQVNTYTSGLQQFPIIKNLNNGKFIIIWSSNFQDGSNLGIFAQLFDDNCNKVGGEFIINTTTDGAQDLPSVVLLDNGNFVVIWRNWEPSDVFSYDIYRQLFDEAGNKIGSEIKINNSQLSTHAQPIILKLNNSNLVVAWADDTNQKICGQLLDAMCNKIGDEFPVNTSPTSFLNTPGIALLSNGNFVVVWQNLYYTPDSLYELRGQVFDEGINKIGDELVIADISNSIKDLFTITALNGGNFLVGFQNSDGNSLGIFSQLFDYLGNKVDTTFRVNTFTALQQAKPLAVNLSNSNILLIWQSYGQDENAPGNPLAINYGIYGQLYYPPLIVNNFNQTHNYTEDTPSSPAQIIISSAFNNTATVALTLIPSTVGSLSTGSIGNTTSTYEASNGQWQATGPLNEINALLASIQFVPSLNHNEAATINVNISDAVQNLPGIINMVGIPVTPLLTNTPGSLNYIENQILAIDAGLTITPEADTPLLPKATVSIISNLAPDQDALNFVNQNNITGMYDRETGRLILTGISSTQNYQTALRNITYTNHSEKPTAQVRTISFTVNDGSTDSPTTTRAINIVSINDAPIVINPLPDQIVQTKKHFQFAVPINTFTDAENDTLTFRSETADGKTLPTWLNFDAQNQIFSGAAPTNPGKSRFALWAQDSHNASVKTEFAIDVTSPNAVFPWWGILLSVLGGTALFGGALGLSYRWYRRSRQAEISLAALEMQEGQPGEVRQEGYTLINNKYRLINKITVDEAKELKKQEGLDVQFEEGKFKTRFTIGQGEFGKLRLAYIQATGQFIGVKKIKGADKIEASQNEGKLQLQLNGQLHIMPLIESVETIGSQRQPVLYQFMPLAGFGNGDTLKACLANATEPNHRLKILVHVAKSLLLGLQAMHQQRIYHLDLKPSNFVIDIRGYVYIIDFGCAEQISKESNHSLLNGGRGDMRYYSPDRIANYCHCLQIEHDNPLDYYDAALADAWALGITLLELSLCYPFDAVTSVSEVTRYWVDDYFNRKLNKINELKDPVPGGYWDLIKGLLSTDPSKRLSIDQALASPIFQNDSKALIFNSDEECQQIFISLKQAAQSTNVHSYDELASQVNSSANSNYTPHTSYASRLTRSSSIFSTPTQPRSDYGNVTSSLIESTGVDKYYSKAKASQIKNNAQQGQVSNDNHLRI